MAHIVPSIAEIERSGVSALELETAQHLEVELGSAFTVYQGVHWNRGSGSMCGEIDFIVVNRDGRILAIEQKKGDLNEGRKLTKTYGDQEKDVRAQIERGVRSIRKKLEKKLKFHNFKLRGRDYNTLVGKILYCPDYHVLDPISAGFEENEIVDSWRREELASTIADTLRAGSGKMLVSPRLSTISLSRHSS